MECIDQVEQTDEHEDIKERVTMYINGKHGRIGIIAPKNRPTETEISQYHRTIAEIIIENDMKKSHQ